ncbi:pyrroline-5-carboxylate reductase [Acidithiobacillus sp. YTS05]|nr:pyrroline-5-carboxylate reductase [Igneacidithiobacillus copahuensis]UTV80567.1 pyrroline-5-carboxylate reductase [Acidithiobacillus sp. YTS05]
MQQQIIFLGAGNMARALIAGLCNHGFPAQQIQVHAPHPQRRDALAAEFGVQSLAAEPCPLPPEAIVVYAAKPKQMRAILTAWAHELRAARVLLISVAAGVRLSSLQALVPEVDVVRVMPNTPTQIGAGASTLYAPAELDTARRQQAEKLVQSTGLAEWLPDEESMDMATALAGSGPAYVFLFLEALEDAAVAGGLYRDQARRLAIATLRGAAELAQQSDLAPALLRHQVTSPGGTTAAGLSAWEEGLRPLAKRALDAASRRSQELAALLAEEL